MEGRSHRSWRACLIGALASAITFGTLLALAYASCTAPDADCNPASFLVLPVVAVVVGIPLMVLLCACLLHPVWRHQERGGKRSAAPFVGIGFLPGVLSAATLIVHDDAWVPGRFLSLLAYAALGVGVPCAVGAYAFYAVMRRERLRAR